MLVRRAHGAVDGAGTVRLVLGPFLRNKKTISVPIEA
jgi:hypothetical protein